MAKVVVLRELTDDEKNLITEAMVHLDRMDKQPSKYNVVSLIRRYYPGRGKDLSVHDIHAAVEQKEKQQHDDIHTD